MNPTWVVAIIAGAGVIFQAGIAYSVVGEFRRLREKVDKQGDDIGDANTRIEQHEWRISSHDDRLHTHDRVLEHLRTKAKD